MTNRRLEMHEINCLYQAPDGLCEPCRLLILVGDDVLAEPHAGALTPAGKTAVMGWADMDGEAIILDRAGCGSYLIPSATWEQIAA